MLYIQKKPSSKAQQILRKLKNTPEFKKIPADNVKALRVFFDNHVPKEQVRQALVQEQHYLCAYCMRRINIDHHTSIEHIQPLSKRKDLVLDYENYLAVCDGSGAYPSCDKARGNEDLKALSPLNKGQMEHISYQQKGKIICYNGQNKEAIEADIELLKLNGYKQKDGSVQDTTTNILRGREYAYQKYLNTIKELVEKNKVLTASALHQEIANLETIKQRFPFVGVTLYYLKKKARQCK